MPSSHVLLIRPHRFFSNPQTAVNNAFQSANAEVHDQALAEFDDLAQLLREKQVSVTVCQDTEAPETPDAIFPNNWISFHEDGSIFLYPMFAENRRLERKFHVLETVRELLNISNVHDLTSFEQSGRFLEGTGSMVLDRHNKIAYSALSPRTNEKVLQEFCRRAGYQAVVFSAVDERSTPVYHTNVMMCVGDNFVVCCSESITDPEEKKVLQNVFVRTGKQLIEISLLQMKNFAGNMLELKNKYGEHLLLMSSGAFHAFSEDQVKTLEKFGRIVHCSLENIEKAGGGSARCMVAELFGSFK